MRARLWACAWGVFVASAACIVISIGFFDDIKTGVFAFLGLSIAFALINDLGWRGKLYLFEIFSLNARKRFSKKIPSALNFSTYLYIAALGFVLYSFFARTPLAPVEARYALLAGIGCMAAVGYIVLRKLRID